MWGYHLLCPELFLDELLVGSDGCAQFISLFEYQLQAVHNDFPGSAGGAVVVSLSEPSFQTADVVVAYIICMSLGLPHRD